MSILVHDPHPLFAEALGRALEIRGHAVTTVDGLGDLSGAVAAFDPDVCVVDATSARPGLAEACARIRAASPAVGLLLLSGRECPWELYDARTVDAVVSKSCGTDVVDDTIRLVAGGGRTVVGWSRPVAVPAQRDAAPAELLTGRERQVLELLVHGFSTRMMAGSLEVSENTVRTHVQNVLSKLGVNGRGKAARIAVDLGIFTR
ncbi:MAG TPA: response regulator transcription factor [Nocardioidaceae bacterium]|nr:response regulator transcription factor [Nocardioidaceae bacterium]